MKKLNQKVVILTVLILANASFAGTYSGGNGTESQPYQIGNPGNWQELMTTYADWNQHFILTADINLAGITLTPVGNDSKNFTGVFDGNRNIISNAVITGNDYVGLFGYVDSGGQIRNLGVENVNMTGSGGSIGGLVGGNFDGTITACYATGSVGGGDHTGGLVGYMQDITEVKSTVTSCYATCSVSGRWGVGGLVGSIGNGGTITSCYATGSVSGTLDNVGGMVGYNAGGIITACYATGSVVGGDKNGGLVGSNGGGTNDTGGIGITFCFWDTQTSGQTISTGGIGLPTVAMQDSEIYLRAFWDFKGEIKNGTNDTWAMPQGGGYPILTWQLGNSPVSNDEMSNAISVTVGSVVSGTSNGATGLDITRNGYKDWADVWYIFTAPSNGDYVIGTLGSDFDTTLAVFDEGLTEIEFNDNYNCKQSKLTLRGIGGVKYYIRIAGYNGQTGNYRLRIINDGPKPLMSDLNGDGNVDFLDFAILTSDWMKSSIVED
jgi:hypothetical protein